MFKLLILSLAVFAFVNVEAKSVNRGEIMQRLARVKEAAFAKVADITGSIKEQADDIKDKIMAKVADVKGTVQDIKPKILSTRPEVAIEAPKPAVVSLPDSVPVTGQAPTNATAKNANVDADDASNTVADDE